MAYALNISTQSKLELLMFFEFDHKGNGVFYTVIFREEGIMNIIHYDVEGVPLKYFYRIVLEW